MATPGVWFTTAARILARVAQGFCDPRQFMIRGYVLMRAFVT